MIEYVITAWSLWWPAFAIVFGLFAIMAVCGWLEQR